MAFLRHLRWALLWALVILGLCVIPGKDIPKIWWAELLSLDKLVHASVFVVLVVFLVRGLRAQYGQLDLRSRRVFWWIAACIAYGGSLEVMQGTLLSDRSADLLDFLANSVGCGVGWWWMRRKEIRAATPST